MGSTRSDISSISAWPSYVFPFTFPHLEAKPEPVHASWGPASHNTGTSIKVHLKTIYTIITGIKPTIKSHFAIKNTWKSHSIGTQNFQWGFDVGGCPKIQIHNIWLPFTQLIPQNHLNKIIITLKKYNKG